MKILRAEAAETNPADYIDENEDLSTIPEAKVYEPELPKVIAKKTRKGPVRIMAPVLGGSDDDDDDATKKPFVPVTGSQKKSNLLSLLPPPKNSISFAPKSSSAGAAAPIPTPTPKATSGGFIPRSVSRPPPPTTSTSSKRRKVDKDSDESDDDDNVAFFTLDKVSSQNYRSPSHKTLFGIDFTLLSNLWN